MAEPVAFKLCERYRADGLICEDHAMFRAYKQDLCRAHFCEDICANIRQEDYLALLDYMEAKKEAAS